MVKCKLWLVLYKQSISIVSKNTHRLLSNFLMTFLISGKCLFNQKYYVQQKQVHDAGHMVPMDQPKAALEMLKRWTQGTLSKSEADAENLVAEM